MNKFNLMAGVAVMIKPLQKKKHEIMPETVSMKTISIDSTLWRRLNMGEMTQANDIFLLDDTNEPLRILDGGWEINTYSRPVFRKL